MFKADINQRNQLCEVVAQPHWTCHDLKVAVTETAAGRARPLTPTKVSESSLAEGDVLPPSGPCGAASYHVPVPLPVPLLAFCAFATLYICTAALMSFCSSSYSSIHLSAPLYHRIAHSAPYNFAYTPVKAAFLRAWRWTPSGEESLSVPVQQQRLLHGAPSWGHIWVRRTGSARGSHTWAEGAKIRGRTGAYMINLGSCKREKEQALISQL